jgi:hypothetical protein
MSLEIENMPIRVQTRRKRRRRRRGQITDLSIYMRVVRIIQQRKSDGEQGE